MIKIKKGFKKDFPIFKAHPTLVYLDSTATSLKPQSVIDAVEGYYTQYSANVARGIYQIAEKATQAYEDSRAVVARFINATRQEEILFTRSTTESINLIAYSLGREIVSKGDEIVTTVMEHHSNFVPWQMLALENGAAFKVIDVTDEGYLDLYDKKNQKSKVKSQKYKSKIKSLNLERVITKNTKILTLTYVSNVLGTINPIKKIARAAKKLNPKIIIVVDAAQAAPHMKIDVGDLGADFVAFSSHKMCGPTGVGVLWGRYELLDRMFPFNFGGEMIDEVHIDRSTFKEPPHKFEAGTPNIAGVIGLGGAVEFLESFGMDRVRAHEEKLVGYALSRLKEEFGDYITIFGPKGPSERGGVVTFTFGTLHPHDIGQILDEDNIAVRVGHHCAMPLHTRFAVLATARASFYIYNDEGDVEKLVLGLRKVRKLLS